jgi:glycosyltransferase involved in cell wall biosynthesis
MPLRDGVEYLAECLQSIRAQSLQDFELLVVDDGSVDAGPDLVQRLGRDDARIRLLRRPALGIVAALNHGLRHARAELVARMDADDIMHPRRLELQHEQMIERPDLTLVACRVDAFPDAALGKGMREYLRWQNDCVSGQQLREQIYVESVFTHPSVMFRRERVIALGGYRDGAFPEDYELWLRIAAAGDPMLKLGRVLLRWRQRAQSLSRVDERYARAAFDMLRARYLSVDPRLHQPRALAIWGAGRRTRRRCRNLFEHGHRVSAWIDIDPRKIGQRIANIPVHGPDWLEHGVPRSQRPFVLVYVASHGAREQIAAHLLTMDYHAGTDYLLVG